MTTNQTITAINAQGALAVTGRPKSVINGKDRDVIPVLLALHAAPDPVILDACHNKGVMWKKSGHTPHRTLDIDPEHGTTEVGDFMAMPYADDSFDVVAFDPPHLPNANATNDRTTGLADVYGIRTQDDHRAGDNVHAYFSPFLAEAKRVLRPNGIVIAKLADLVHNHHYQWQHVEFVLAARAAGMTPCDLVIKVDPTTSNLTSSKWKNVRHLRRAHTYWLVVRNGRCERKGA